MYFIKDVHLAFIKYRALHSPRLGFDPIGVGSCVPRVHLYVFCFLKCKNIAIKGDFLQYIIEGDPFLSFINRMYQKLF